MTPLDLKGIRDRLEKAAPGPWLTPKEAGNTYDQPLDHESQDVWPWHNEDDMIFAYASRSDIPLLLAEIDRLKQKAWEA